MNRLIAQATRQVVVAGLALAMGLAHAQDWPSRPIKVVLGVAPGGLIDVSARLLAADLATKLGQPVLVENRPGANTTIGANAVVQAQGDGYTFFYGGVMSASPVFVKNNAVDATTQLKPVSMVLSAPFFLMVNSKKVPAKTFQELVDYSKKNPDALNFTDGAPLSTMVMYAIAARSGLKFTPIPYKGSAPSMQALIAGEAQIALDTVPNYIQHIHVGTVRPLLNTSNARYPQLPNVPTTSDVKGLDLNAASVLSMWAPKSTPDAIVKKMSVAIAELAKDEAFRTKFRVSTNVDPIGSTPEELLRSIQADKDLYTQVAKQVGFAPQ